MVARNAAVIHTRMFGGNRIVDPGPAMGSEDFSELARLPDGQAIPYWFLPVGAALGLRERRPEPAA
ncbi:MULTISPECIES: hypothetical protein [unclassified Streptomyces]|uniref:hypothetical protein n=1 Tax=unclassified Streptomyces TaxID=2593676 RepID=UPI00211D3D94|nr:MULTISPECIES: hypothetical protein [unclassified Streptomyces]